MQHPILTPANRALMKDRCLTDKVLEAMDRGEGVKFYPENINDIIEQTKAAAYSVDLAGVLANINTGRWTIVRNGESVDLTADERSAITTYLRNTR